MSEPFTPPAVVVGVDGSRAGAHAAAWAVDEALSRDVPLRLVAVAAGNDDAADHLAEAERTVGAAAADRAVKIQTQVLTGDPAAALLEESRTAAMICVGAVGLDHFERDRLGSTAGALVAAAHCPVAVIRSAGPTAGSPGWVVVELDETPESAAVLQSGVEEARLRGAPLRVLGSWQSRYTDVHDSHAVSDGNRMVRAQLDRRLAEWRHRYPDLDARPVAVHGSMLNYLATNAAAIQLVVVGMRNDPTVGDLIGPTGMAALHDTDCSVLVIDRQRLL